MEGLTRRRGGRGNTCARTWAHSHTHTHTHTHTQTRTHTHTHTTLLLRLFPVYWTPQQSTVDREIKIPSSENPGWNRSEYRRACLLCCQEFYSPISFNFFVFVSLSLSLSSIKFVFSLSIFKSSSTIEQRVFYETVGFICIWVNLVRSLYFFLCRDVHE